MENISFTRIIFYFILVMIGCNIGFAHAKWKYKISEDQIISYAHEVYSYGYDRGFDACAFDHPYDPDDSFENDYLNFVLSSTK